MPLGEDLYSMADLCHLEEVIPLRGGSTPPVEIAGIRPQSFEFVGQRRQLDWRSLDGKIAPAPSCSLSLTQCGSDVDADCSDVPFSLNQSLVLSNVGNVNCEGVSAEIT